MDKGKDYKIAKIEKGPLQRFKNQNLLLKKFGELGLQLYKVITGKRTVQELRKDLDMEEGEFAEIISYMEEAGMVELTQAGASEDKSKKSAKKFFEKKGPAASEPEEEKEEKEEPIKSRFHQREQRAAHELDEEPTEEEHDEEETHEEEPREDEEIKPYGYGMGKGKEKEEDEEPGEDREEKTKDKEEESEEEEKEEEPKEETVPVSEEIKPEGIEPASEEDGEKEENEEETKEEEPAEEEEKEEEKPADEEFIAPHQDDFSSEGKEFGGELSSVEKIIKERYGEVGLKVYTLIDGQRTAEEIMQDTGLSESKLVEILDFMDAQGIIKLEYPERKGGAGALGAVEKKDLKEDFKPILEETADSELPREISPVEMPIKAPMDIIKGMHLKAKLMLKAGDKGGKILEEIDGKKDVLDIALKLGVPLYALYDVLKILISDGAILMRPLNRADVKKKYGDDAFAVYKRYGREGLMLYELIGKELTIKQMAEKITKDKAKIVDMFIFIHQVLGIELPIDREVLGKQLGI